MSYLMNISRIYKRSFVAPKIKILPSLFTYRRRFFWQLKLLFIPRNISICPVSNCPTTMSVTRELSSFMAVVKSPGPKTGNGTTDGQTYTYAKASG